MISGEAIGMIALFVAIGGQYGLLFRIYQKMTRLELEIATCPYHRTGRRPPGVHDDG